MTARKESTNTQVTVVESDAVVATISRARTALAEAKTIQETKHVLDMAAAAEIYARRQKLGEEAEGLAHSIRIEALRKLGEMLAATERNEGAKGVGKSAVTKGDRTQQSAVTSGDHTPTLEEMGLTKRESAVAQKLAALPAKDFEQVRDGHIAVSKAIAAVDAAKETKRAAKPAEPVKTVDSAEVDSLREQIAELTANLKETLADNESMARVFEADDKVKAALAEAKRYRELNRILEERIAGLMNEKNAAIRSAKSWQRKAEAAERAQA